MESGGIFGSMGFGRGGSPDEDPVPSTSAAPCPGGHFMMPDGECVQANCSPGLVFDSITSRCVPVGHTVDPADLPSSTPKPVPTIPSAPFDPTVDVGPLGPQKASMLMVGGAALLAAVVVGGVLLSSSKNEKTRSSSTAKANRRYRRNPGVLRTLGIGVAAGAGGFVGGIVANKKIPETNNLKDEYKSASMIGGASISAMIASALLK